MKNRKRGVIIATLLCLIPVVVGLILGDKLPDMLPSHFDFNGEADSFVNKNLMIIGFPLLFAAITLFLGFILNTDPKKANQTSKLYQISLILIPVLANVTINASYLIGMGYDFNISNVILPLIGIMFIVIGNYLPKIKQNYTMGVKLPWTLNDEDNWNKTHRLTGILWVIGGFIFFIIPFFNFLLFVNLFILLVVPIVYSFVIYQKKLRG